MKKIKFINFDIKNPNKNYESEILSKLNFHVLLKKEIYSMANNDEAIIKNYLPFIYLYLKDYEVCLNCNKSLKECPKESIGTCLKLVFENNSFHLENTFCKKYFDIINEIKNINLFYDDPFNFYLEGSNLINYIIDLDTTKSKIISETKLIINYAMQQALKKKDYKSYLIYSKKDKLSNRILKAISILFNNKKYKVTYLNSNEFFSNLFYDGNYSSINDDLKKALTSDVLLINNIDQIPNNNLQTYEDYLGYLLTYREKNKLITYASCKENKNATYLCKKYFNTSNNYSSYLDACNNLFDYIIVKDEL